MKKMINEDRSLIVYSNNDNIINYPIALYDKNFTDRFINEATKAGGYRYSLSSYTTSPSKLPIILNIALFKLSESANSLTIAIEFPEESDLSEIEDILMLANVPYNKYSQNFVDMDGHEITGNRVIEIYSNTLEGVATLRNLYFKKHQDSTYLLEIVLAPMVDWSKTKDDPKWKEKIELWFSSWADKASSESYKAPSNAKCILAESNYSIAVVPYSSENSPEFYNEHKIKQLKIREFYNSLSKEELDTYYYKAIIGTIESTRQGYFREFTKDKVTQRYVDRQLHDLEKCINIFSLNHNSSVTIVKKFIGDMHEIISPKDKNYEKVAKNAKDLSTLTGVASDLIIDPALVALTAFWPEAGIAASLIKGAIFYGISITKTASCGYSLITRNFNSEEEKNTYVDKAKKLTTGLTCKSILCSMDKFVFLGNKEISILKEIFKNVIGQANFELDVYKLTNQLLDQLGNGSYTSGGNLKYADILFTINESYPIDINDYFYYDQEACYGKLLGLNYTVTMEG